MALGLKKGASGFLGLWCLSVMAGSPLPTLRSSEPQSIDSYDRAARGVTDALEQSGSQGHHEPELPPLPESLPWPVHYPASNPSPTELGPHEWPFSLSTPHATLVHLPSNTGLSPHVSNYFPEASHTASSWGFDPLPPSRDAPYVSEQPATMGPLSYPRYPDMHSSGNTDHLLPSSSSSWGQDPAAIEHWHSQRGGMHLNIQYQLVQAPVGRYRHQEASQLPEQLALPRTEAEAAESASSSNTGEARESQLLEEFRPRSVPPTFTNGMLGFPERVPLPDAFAWDPSPKLQNELITYLKSQFLYTEYSAPDLTPEFAGQQHDFILEVPKSFRGGSQVYAFQLPSRPVLVKFHTRSFFNKGNPFQLSLTLWTIDQRGSEAPVLVLRGLFGVANVLNDRFRRLTGKVVYTVMSPSSSRVGTNDKYLQLNSFR